MRPNLIRLLKHCVTLIVLILLVSTCERDDETIKPQTHNTTQGSAVDVKTVSFETAISHFNSKQNRILSQRFKQRPSAAYGTIVNQPIEVTPDWSTLTLVIWAYTNAQLTTADSAINRALYFIEVNNYIRNVILTLWKDKTDAEGRVIDGRIFFNDLDGQFMDGYIIEEGVFTKRYVVQDQVQQAMVLPLALFQFTTEGIVGTWIIIWVVNWMKYFYVVLVEVAIKIIIMIIITLTVLILTIVIHGITTMEIQEIIATI